MNDDPGRTRRAELTRRGFAEAGCLPGVITVSGLATPAFGRHVARMLGPAGMHPADPAARAFLTDAEAALR